MKLTYTTADGRLTFEIEGKTQLDLWTELARIQETFEDNPSANINGKEVSGGDVRYRVRQAKFVDEKGKDAVADYYEKVVISGPMKWYKKSYGVLNDKSGGLFPHKAPDKPNVNKGYNGWYYMDFTKDKKDEEPSV
jgi:hypothetical protein